MIIQLRRWLPNRPLVLVADSSYAVLDLLHFCQSMDRPVTLITRLRLDAALYEPASPRLPSQIGRPRVKGERLPTLRELLDCPDTRWTSAVVAWYHGDNRTVELSSHTASGIMRASRRCPFAGFSFETPYSSSIPRRCCVLLLRSPRSRSSSGSCCAGKWR